MTMRGTTEEKTAFIDCGVDYSGYDGGAARTFRVGAASRQAGCLLEVTRRAARGSVLEHVAASGSLRGIGRAAASCTADHGYSVVAPVATAGGRAVNVDGENWMAAARVGSLSVRSEHFVAAAPGSAHVAGVAA